MITGNEPKDSWYNNETDEMNGGLTIRQYFTAMAMQGMLANPLINDFVQKGKWNLYETCVGHANDLIIELNKAEQ